VIVEKVKPHAVLILWVSFLFLLGVALTAKIYQEHERVAEREKARLMGQARVVQQIAAWNLSSLNKVMDGLRQDAGDRDMNSFFNHRLSDLVDAMPGVRTLMLLDADGIVRSADKKELLDRNFRDRYYFRRASEDGDPERLYVSPPFRTVLNTFVINVSKIIRNSRGEFAGVVSASLDPDYFTTLLSSVRYEGDMWTALIHGDGDIFLIIPDIPGVSGKNLNRPGTFFRRHFESGSGSTTGSGTVYATAEDRFIAVQTIRPESVRMDKPLVVFATRDKREAYRRWMADLVSQVTLFLLFAAVSTLTLSLFQKRRRETEAMKEQAASELLKKQREVEESERFIRMVTDNIPGMVGYWTDELRCSFANHAFLDWFGKTSEQMSGIHMRELIGEERYSEDQHLFAAVLRGEPQLLERMLEKEEAGRIYILVNCVPDILGENVRGFFVLVSDVTEMKQAHIELKCLNSELEKRVLEAESANRFKSEFLANMSHEIRTPMNAVLGLTRFLLEMELPVEVKEYLRKIHASSQALLKILNSILDFSKIEAGRVEIEHIPFSVSSVIDEAAGLFSVIAEEKGINIATLLDPALPTAVTGDRQRLSQVLNNIVGNAIKFTESGEVKIEAYPEEIDENGILICIRVSDTGIGIPPELKERLFQPFTQADGAITRKYGGTGLGLSICRDLVRLMGGDIRIENGERAGSIFTFSIRVGHAFPGAIPESPEPAAAAVTGEELSAASPAPRVDFESLLNLIVELEKYLHEQELVPDELIQQLQNASKGCREKRMAVLLNSLLRRLDNFDHAGALETAERIKEMTPEP